MRRKESPEHEADAPLGEVLDFLRVLWTLDHELQSFSKRMESTLGVTGPQRLAIRLVGRFPGISAGKLAGVMRIHPSTLTGIIHRLKRRGLLAARRDARDGRRLLLALTERGREIDAKHAGTVESAVARALADVPPAQAKAVRKTLENLIAALEAERG